jgi:hypothetical protein
MFGSLVVLYILSALFHGALRENLSGAAKPLVAFLWWLLLRQEKPDVRRALWISGTIAAAAGLISYALNLAGLPAYPGAVNNGRLYGTFQYANAYALFIAVCAFTGCNDLSVRHRYIKITSLVLTHAALLLTLSVGGIAVYALAWFLLTFQRRRKALKYWLVGVPAAAFAGFLAVGIRPVSTFLDRILHISDALAIGARNILGIGPGRWKFEFLEFQTTFYYVNKVHSAYAEVAAEAGYIALALVVIMVIYYIRKTKPGIYKIAALMILFHAAFDFSLSFFSVTLQLLALCTAGAEEGTAITPKPQLRLILAVPCLLLNLISFAPGTDINEMDRYRLLSERYLREGDIPGAVEAAFQSVEHAPYAVEAYTWVDTLTPLLDANAQEDCLDRITELKVYANAHKNPLAELARKLRDKYYSTLGD